MSNERDSMDRRPSAGCDRALIRVLIADGNAAVRRTLRLTLERAGLEVVGEAIDGNEAAAIAARVHPDVALIDCRMREPDCVEAARRLRSTAGVGAAVLLDIYGEFKDAARVAGLPFLLKDASLDDLVAALRAAAGHAADGLPPSP